MNLNTILGHIQLSWNRKKDNYILYQTPDMIIVLTIACIFCIVAVAKALFEGSITINDVNKLLLVCVGIPIFIGFSIYYIYNVCAKPSKLIINKKGIHYYEGGIVTDKTRVPRPHTWHTYHWNRIHSFYFDTDNGYSYYQQGIIRRTIVLNMQFSKDGRIAKRELRLRHFHFNYFHLRKAIDYYSGGMCQINKEEQRKVIKQELIVIALVTIVAVFALIYCFG